jgi:hypothetical protein
MERMIAQAFSEMSQAEKASLSTFGAVFKVDDHGNGEYTICSDVYTERILPCFAFDHWREARIDDYSEMCELIKKGSDSPYKIDKLFWAGQVSHPTRKLFVEKFSLNPKIEIIQHKDHWGHSSSLPENYLSLPDHCNYKYLLDLQGNGYSARVKFLLHTKRPLFYQARKFHEYWFWDLKPFVHYIPVKEDLSDLQDMIDWAENHPSEREAIAQNAYDFALSNLKREDAMARLKSILIRLGGQKQKPSMTLCVLACCKNEKYKNRLREFVHSYGFKDLDGDTRVVFLVEDEQRPDFLDDRFGWHNSPGIPLSMRLMRYLSEEQCDSDWIMQVDDDSSTDIDKTREILCQFYDPSDAMILMGGRNTDLEMGLQHVVKKMSVPNFLFSSGNISKFDTTPYFIHAWEPSIISREGAKRIRSWVDLKEFMSLCESKRPIFGDQVPYVAARLAKVPIVECLFLSPFCKSEEYSAINPKGRFSHIHYVTDKWGEYDQFKKNMLEAKSGQKISKDPNSGDFWEFYAEDSGKYRNIGIIRLDNDGKIGSYNNFNERFWRKEGDKIIIMDENGHETCIMTMKSEGLYFGPFLKRNNVMHFIKRISHDTDIP